MSHDNLESFNPAILKPGSWEPSTAGQERNGSDDVNPFTARIEGAKPLSEIVEELNEENGADFTEADKVPAAGPEPDPESDIEPEPEPDASVNSRPELEPGAVAFNRLNLMAAKVASKDTNRRNLNGVHFVGNKTIATDGHMMVLITAPEPYDENEPRFALKEGFTIRTDDLPPLRKNDQIVLESPADQGGKVTGSLTSDKGHEKCFVPEGVEYSLCTVDADFPDYNMLIPEGEPKFSVSLNPVYLKTLMEIHKAAGMRVTLEFRDELSPVVLKTVTAPVGEGPKTQTVTSVLMPMRA